MIEKISIGGIEQSILIQAGDKDKPILLVLHGGPGMPFPGVSCRAVENISQVTTSKLVRNFKLIYWDQRGTGKSFSNKINNDSMNIGQYISDANELVDRLRERFNTDKIYLAGISWGSVIGMNMVRQFPNKFYAYFGIAQIINWAESDQLSYPWALEHAKSTNNKKAEQELMKVGLPPYEDSYDDWKVLRKWLMKFGGYTYKDDLIKPPSPISTIQHLLFSPDYTIRDIINTFKGLPLAFCYEMISDFSEIHHIEIPVYFFHGKHDKVCNITLMESFFNKLSAPLGKHLIWLDNSAHFFYVDDAKKVEKIIVESIKDIR
ncbi:MAG: alpha/beta hydrolase [Bacillota bacterium]|nr:alpha/beta hydrolase [Bacillota bacterium]